jgi:hypothetical protein
MEQTPKPGGAPRQLKIKITDDVLRGAYCNNLMVMHTKEEFVLDFLSLFPPHGTVTARVVTSPGHLKRIIAALKVNLDRYEATYGAVTEAPEPPKPPGIYPVQ